MKIEIYYKNGDQDIYDTDSLTSSEGHSFSGKYTSITTKYHITWGEFMKEVKPSNLNLYIYFYRNNNDRGSSIFNPKYLDEIMFFNNDRPIYKNMTKEQIQNNNKMLPYGSLEPSTWFTLIPAKNKHEILKIDVDNETRIYRSHTYDELIDVFKFNTIEGQYCNEVMRKKGLDERMLYLFKCLTATYLSPTGDPIKDEEDIAFEMGIPYSLICKIEDNVSKISSAE